MFSNQKGFSPLVVIAAAVVVGVIGFAGWRVLNSSSEETNRSNQQAQQNQTGGSSQNQTSGDDDTDVLVLQNLGLASLDSVLITQNAVREFKDKGLKGFYVFGESLSGNRLNPNFEFASLKPDTKVIAAIDGIVAFIKEQPDSKDYEVFLQPKDKSQWTIGYDHIKNVAVQKGAAIKAGDVIGEPAEQNDGRLRFEIQINKDSNNQTTHVCPTTLLADEVKAATLAALTAMQQSWESTTGFELYDITAQDPVGCLQQTLTPAQAEGR